MNRQGLFCTALVIICLQLSACLGSVWTGATLIYDRHNVYKKVDDYSLAMAAQHALFDDKILRQEGINLDLAVFNGDILLAGHLPDTQLRRLAISRVQTLSGYREFFPQLAIQRQSVHDINDTWLTARVRSRMMSDSSIDPGQFKIVTVDGIVYIMGDVKPKQARRVIQIARNVPGVVRVVKLMRYYNLSEKPADDG